MSHVLVTGAAGLVGSAVLQLLAAEGIAATALVQEPVARPLAAARTVVGDAREPAVVADALRGADAVIHLAAIPAPNRDPDDVVFAHNTQATFTVLDQAGWAGIGAAAFASIDTALPLQITDPYALSKQADEATAAMVSRQYGMTVVAMRLPFVGTPDPRLTEAAQRYADHPESGAADVWSYLDARDAARAMVAALDPAEPGNHVVYVAAPETLAPYPTEDLLDRFHPGVPRPAFEGRTVPIDLTPARDLLGFAARHPWDVA
jgi:nucleoside-diphosphate-sugar epimerase